MNSNFTLTEGARIGRANATYPFATLSVNKDVLEINASVIGNLVFQPRDILSIEPYTAILGKGIRIQHRVESYNPQVIFWTTKDPHFVIAQINETGFSDHLNDMTDATDPEVAMRQTRGDFPLKRRLSSCWWFYGMR